MRMMVSSLIAVVGSAAALAACGLGGCSPRHSKVGDAADRLMKKIVQGSLGFAVEQSVRIRAQDYLVNRGRWPRTAESFFSMGPVGLRYYTEKRTIMDHMSASEVVGFRLEVTKNCLRCRFTWRGRAYEVDVYEPDDDERETLVGREIERRFGGPSSDFGVACREASSLDGMLTLCFEDEYDDRVQAFDSKTNRGVLENSPLLNSLPDSHVPESASRRPWRYYVPTDFVGRKLRELPEWTVTLAVQGDVPLEGATSDGYLLIDMPAEVRRGKPTTKSKKFVQDWFVYDGLG